MTGSTILVRLLTWLRVSKACRRVADVIISRSVYEDAKVRELIESKGLSAVEFDMSLKGFDDERFELWRVSQRNNARPFSRSRSFKNLSDGHE